MTMDVRKPGAQGPFPTERKVAPQGPAQAGGVTAAQALQNAQLAFALVFDAAPPVAAPAQAQIIAVTPDAVAAAEVKTQLVAAFEALKAAHLQVKPEGAAAKAFAHPLVDTLAEAAPPALEREAQALAKENLPPAARRALDKATDVFWAKKIDGLQGEQALLNTPWAQHLASARGAADKQKLAPVVLPLAGWITSGSPASQRMGTGAPPTVVGGSDPMTIPSEVGEKIDMLFGTKGFSANWANMDVGDAVMIMMMLIAGDASKDLRDQLAKMEHTMKLKQAKRQLIAQIKEDEAKMKDEMKKEYDRLMEEGKLDESITFDQFLAACPITFVEPQINEETYQLTYTEPTIAAPNPLPDEFGPKPDPSESGAINEDVAFRIPKHLAAGLVNFQEQADNDMKNAMNNMRQTADDSAPPPGEESDGMRQSSSQAPNSSSNFAGPAIATTAIAAKPPGRRGVNPGILQNIGTSVNNLMQPDAGTRARFNMSDLDVAKDRYSDELESLAEMSDIEQLKMQMYLDRRQKAFETATNVRKKLEDTSGGIIKNWV